MPESPFSQPAARLAPGDTLAVLAPASPAKSAEALHTGITYLEQLGFRVEYLQAVAPPRGYLAAPDADRLDLFNRLLRRDDLNAIFCVRGGYGTLRLLPYLDYDAARRHPKLLVGYSDITALHLALYQQAGWRGLSGPMVAVEWGAMDEAVERLFWQLVQGERLDPLLGPNDEPLRPLRPGSAEGVLLGGNLSVIARLVGTPYLPDLAGALLFLEDVGEAPYRLDGLLAHLKLAGILDRLGGVVLGGFTEWASGDDRPTLTPDEIFADYFGKASYPVATELAYGHFPVKATLPVGVRARLDVDEYGARLAMLEPVTA